MSTPYTKKRALEHRGPLHSEDHNLRVDENYKDLVYLYNKLSQLDLNSSSSYTAMFKQFDSVLQKLLDLEVRLGNLEHDGALFFYSNDQVDIDNFDSTPYEVSSVDRCYFNNKYSFLTLPKVMESSVSKIRFTHPDGTFNVSNGLEVLVVPNINSADDSAAVIESSSPYDSIMGKPGRVWERNVIADAQDAVNGAQMYLYIKIPNGLSITDKTNYIEFMPYPVYGIEVMSLEYSTEPNASLSTISSWVSFNENQIYFENAEAVGHIPPGGWSGDEIKDSGPKGFYFEPRSITAVRIGLRQDDFYINGANYIYSYGLSQIDVRYDKFLSTGKTIVKLEAPTGETISNVTEAIPHIWNVPQSLIPEVFSYRVLWETAPDSGTYQTDPVGLSERVWVEITLNQVENGYTPVLTSLQVNYT